MRHPVETSPTPACGPAASARTRPLFRRGVAAAAATRCHIPPPKRQSSCRRAGRSPAAPGELPARRAGFRWRDSSAFAVVTGHECNAASDLDWGALARMPTLVVLMGLSALREIAARLLAHGAHPDTPAAAIADGTLPTQRTVVGTLATIAAQVAAAGLEAPATVILGEVVRAAHSVPPSAAEVRTRRTRQNGSSAGGTTRVAV